jgi:hypothetical protein
LLLLHTYPDPRVNLTLELFLRVVRDVLGDNLVSVVLQGAVVFDDLAPGYSDLDFVAVLADEDLSDETCQRLIEARKPLRAGRYGTLAWALEGPFLPRRMLDPRVTGRALCWGTGGERHWEANRLGGLVHRVIRERGQVIFGDDLIDEFTPASREAMVAEVRAFCQSAREHGSGGTVKSVDWLLTAARLLWWLREDRLSSKSAAAEWAFANAEGAWREHLPRAREVRLNPALEATAAVWVWLHWLPQFIREAADEVENAAG